MAKFLTKKGLEITASPGESLDAQNEKIVNVADPTNDQDVATKAYVDDFAGEAAAAVDAVFRIENQADDSKKIAFDASEISTETTRTITMPDADVDLGDIADKVDSADVGEPNGVASLDSNGKVPVTQLPNSIMEYKGTWNADTNTPELENGSANNDPEDVGDVYRVVEAGSHDFGAGAIEFEVGDYAILNDDKIWEKAQTSEVVAGVSSVNGEVVDVVLDSSDLNHSQDAEANWTVADDSTMAAHLDELAARTAAIEDWDTDDIDEGSSNLYFTEARVLATLLAGYSSAGSTLADTDSVLEAFQKLDAELENKLESGDEAVQSVNGETGAVELDTDDIDEGETNLYHTEARARDAAVVDSLAGTETDQAPSVASVNAALDDKADQSDMDAAEGRLDDLEADSGRSFEIGVAGESMAANELFFVRRAKSGETSGRYYLAQADEAANARVVGFVMTDTAVTAADPIRVYKLGEADLGSADVTAERDFDSDDNSIVYLSQEDAGKWTLTPSDDSEDYIKEIGFVAEDAKIEFQIGFGFEA